MYRNKESVIIGRNQNPWKEINQTALRQSNIEFTSLHTKGVASVRSPVANLVSFSPKITHDTFVHAVARAFREKYYQQETSNDAVVHVEHGNEI
ncbi:hypothetical protein FRC07_009170, partial [Ceratobasidium sp. 392]